MHDTLGPKDLVPSAVVFGEFPKAYKYFEMPLKRPTLEQRSDIAHSAQKYGEAHGRDPGEMGSPLQRPESCGSIFSAGRSSSGLKRAFGKSKIEEWIGPFTVPVKDAESILVRS